MHGSATRFIEYAICGRKNQVACSLQFGPSSVSTQG